MRSFSFALLLGAFLLLVAACSTTSDDDADSSDASGDSVTPTEAVETATEEPEPTATPAPTPTEEPEATATEEPDTGDEATAEPADDQLQGDSGDQGELGHLLMSVEDLGGEWSEITDVPADIDAEEFSEDIADEPFEAPCGVDSLEDAYDPVAEADRSFQQTELGPFFSQNIIQLESADEASDAMQALNEVFSCDEWSEIDEFGEEIVFEVNDVSMSDFGDESFGIQISFVLGDEPEMEMFGDIGFDLVFVRVDQYVSMFMYFDIFGMSDVDLETLVQQAEEKIRSGI